MSFSVWLSLFTALVIISFTPGAGAINTMSNALASGWRRSLWGVIGQQLALIVHIVIVAAGVGVFVARSPMLFNGIRYAGAAYLVYLGLRMFFAKPKAADTADGLTDDAADDPAGTETATETAVSAGASAWSMVVRGFWVNMLNPKAIVFYLAFIPQFIKLDQPQLPQYLILAVTSVVVDTLVMWFFFAAAARPFGRYASTVRGQRVLNTVFGGLFVAVAALLLFVH